MRTRVSRLGWAPVLLALASLVAAGPAGPPSDTPGGAGAGTAPAVVITSGAQDRDGDMVRATEFVDVRYKDIVLQADYVELNTATKDVVAEGNVVLQQGARRLAGERLEFNLDTRLGRMERAWGYVDPEVFFTASEVAKTGEERYDLRGASVTSCTQPRPQWRLRASRGTYKVDSYVRLWNTRMEVLGVPLLYLPVFQYPARRDRSTGFLFPALGVNSLRGFSVANSFFWAIGRSYDATLNHEWFRDGTQELGTEFRYVPSRDASGVFQSQYLRPADPTESTGSVYRMTHNQRFARTWRLGATIDYASDSRLTQQYSRNINTITQRRRQSSAYLERNWSRYSFSFGGDHLVVYSGDKESKQYRLPGVSFGVRDTRLLGPLYGAWASEFVRFGSQPSGKETTEWGRFDLDQRYSMPLRPFPWMEMRPQGGYRVTYWTEGFEPGTGRTKPSDEAFTRRFGTVGMTIVGPILQRIYNTPNSGYSDKFKHVIEPEISWGYTSVGDEYGQSQNLDAVDRLGRYEQHGINFALRNRLLARRSLVPGAVPTPHELILVELFTGYDLRGDVVDRLQPLIGNVRVVPTQSFSSTYRFSYDMKEGYFSRHSVQAAWRSSSRYADVTFSRTAGSDRATSEEVRTSASTELFAGRLMAGGGVTYDLLGKDLRDLRYDLVWRTQCCGFGFGYHRYNFGQRDDSELRFSISLKNIGTVFDYTTGDQAPF